MSNPTTPFGWQMPTATDLVTDLPADFEVFGQAVATSMGDLLGGTTGQILSKASNTDMDFTWTSANPGDITGVTAGVGISGGGTSGDVTVTNSMATAMTTSGDLIQATGSGTFARLGTGTNGQYLTTNGTTNSWSTLPSAAPTSGQSRVDTSQTTTSTSYVGLTTAQAVTVTTGTKVLVMISCLIQGADQRDVFASYAVSGATTLAASDTWSIMNSGDSGTGTKQRLQMSYVSYQTVTAGSNTFTMQFRTSNASNTATFANRQITVIDLGS